MWLVSLASCFASGRESASYGSMHLPQPLHDIFDVNGITVLIFCGVSWGGLVKAGVWSVLPCPFATGFFGGREYTPADSIHVPQLPDSLFDVIGITVLIW